MGTSASSKGPGGGVPMVPPWVPPAPPPPAGAAPGEAPAAQPDGGAQPDASATPNSQEPARAQPRPTAPAGRFRSARTSLGKFAGGGGGVHMRRGLRDYVRKGYGGKATAVQRFASTARTAEALYAALSNVVDNQTGGNTLDRTLLGGRSAREIMDAVIEAVRPADGTQDAEANRASAKDALSELLTAFPNADLLELTEEQRDAAIERFVWNDVFRRVMLDVGKAIQDKATSAAAGLSRLREVKDYVRQTVAASFRKLANAGHRMTTGRVGQIVRAAIEDTFQVFESYRR
jgi:hypothetical protein